MFQESLGTGRLMRNGPKRDQKLPRNDTQKKRRGDVLTAAKIAGQSADVTASMGRVGDVQQRQHFGEEQQRVILKKRFSTIFP